MRKTISNTVNALSILSCIGNASSGILFYVNLVSRCMGCSTCVVHRRIEKLTYLIVGCAGLSTIFHIPLLIRPRLRLLIIFSLLFSFSFLTLETVLFTYLRGSYDLFKEIYHIIGNSSFNEVDGKYWRITGNIKLECCGTWNAIQQGALQQYFPFHWVPNECCTVMHNTEYIEKCLDSKHFKNIFEKYACFHGSIEDISREVQEYSWIILTSTLIGVLANEVFLYVILNTYRMRW